MDATNTAQAWRRLNASADTSANELGWELVGTQVPRRKQITLDCGELTYTERGKGQPVIFVHGALSDYRTWSPQLNSLSHRYHVISYSRRYHQAGIATNYAADYTHRRHVGDLIALIEALGLGPAHLVGHSYGGTVAALAAMERPEMVRSLILGEPSLFSVLTQADDMVSLRLHRIALNVVQKLAENGEQRLAIREYCNIVLGKDAFGELPLEALLVITQNAHTLGPMLRTYFEPTELDCNRAQTINTPTLVVTGELSPKIYRAISRQLDSALPNSELRILPAASHGLQMENPADFNAAVLEFVSRNEIPAKREDH
jgi:pimeloyl-ACP methyl ester carboxylesterase